MKKAIQIAISFLVLSVILSGCDLLDKIKGTTDAAIQEGTEAVENIQTGAENVQNAVEDKVEKVNTAVDSIQNAMDNINNAATSTQKAVEDVKNIAQ